MITVPKRAAVLIVTSATVVSLAIGVYRYDAQRRRQIGLEVNAASNPIHVPLSLPRELVRHQTRFACRWDGKVPLAPLREAENLDAVVRGAASDEERARKLMFWTRAQFEPGRPDPYPPPDATTTLQEIRSGRTGGFCAQYAFVLVQALQSFGMPARVVTIQDHEVTETWLADQARWTMLDPLFDLQLIDQGGRSLSAIEIRHARQARATLAVTAGARLAEPLPTYVARFDQIGIWIRNAFVSEPMNFADFDRYHVWLVGGEERSPSPESLSTTHHDELYGPPSDFPESSTAASNMRQAIVQR